MTRVEAHMSDMSEDDRICLHSVALELQAFRQDLYAFFVDEEYAVTWTNNELASEFRDKYALPSSVLQWQVNFMSRLARKRRIEGPRLKFSPDKGEHVATPYFTNNNLAHCLMYFQRGRWEIVQDGLIRLKMGEKVLKRFGKYYVDVPLDTDGLIEDGPLKLVVVQPIYDDLTNGVYGIPEEYVLDDLKLRIWTFYQMTDEELIQSMTDEEREQVAIDSVKEEIQEENRIARMDLW